MKTDEGFKSKSTNKSKDIDFESMVFPKIGIKQKETFKGNSKEVYRCVLPRRYTTDCECWNRTYNRCQGE